MVTLLLTSFLVIAALAIAIYFWQKPRSSNYAEQLEAPPGQALFPEGTPSGIAQAEADATTNAIATAQQFRVNLLERAKAGGKATLNEALADTELYDEVLNTLTGAANSPADLLSLVSYLTRNKLRVNRVVAEKFISSSAANLDRATTAKMLHVAALSDDAGTYQKAVEATLRGWREGSLSGVSAQELRTILEGEFWVLSANTRSSGAGFILKRALADARRKLVAAHRE